MNDLKYFQGRCNRAQNIALFIGIVLILVSSIKALTDSARFYQSYLFAYLFWLELTLGSMAMLMVYCLTGGGWGVVTRRILISSMQTIYLMALLFIPIFLGARKIFPWTDITRFKLEDFAHKALYYNFSFFTGRAIFYLVSFMILAYILGRWLDTKKAVKLSGAAITYLGIIITWAAIDWQMSLDPLWYSTIYGMVFVIGQAFGAWAFTILVCKIIIYFQNSIILPAKIELDLANLLLTLVILWAYLSFMQYLIIWSGNLPDEVTWFNKRMNHGWQYIMGILFLFQFGAPFSVLLFRNLKYRKIIMIILTSIILLVRILDRYWMIMPAFTPKITVSYVDITLLLGLGGLWIAMFLRNLKQRSVFALEDPNWPKAKQVLIHA